jgi:hypothetical protein
MVDTPQDPTADGQAAQDATAARRKRIRFTPDEELAFREKLKTKKIIRPTWRDWAEHLGLPPAQLPAFLSFWRKCAEVDTENPAALVMLHGEGTAFYPDEGHYDPDDDKATCRQNFAQIVFAAQGGNETKVLDRVNAALDGAATEPGKRKLGFDPQQRKRSKRSDTPQWLMNAFLLLKESDGVKSDRCIAKEVGVSHTTLLRRDEWKRARQEFPAAKLSQLNEAAMDENRRSRTKHEKVEADRARNRNGK